MAYRPRQAELLADRLPRPTGRKRKLLAWQVSYVVRAIRLRRQLSNARLGEKMGVCEATINHAWLRHVKHGDRYGRDNLPNGRK